MWDKYKCYAGYYYMVIGPFGRGSPCTFLHNDMGSVRERSLMDVWSGMGAKNWRNLAKNKVNKCICWCGISEVNAVLTDKLENKYVKSLTNNIILLVNSSVRIVRKKVDIKAFALQEHINIPMENTKSTSA